MFNYSFKNMHLFWFIKIDSPYSENQNTDTEIHVK